MTALKRAWRSWRKRVSGRVIEVNATTAKVELLTSKNVNSNHFPVRVTSANGESFGLLKITTIRRMH